MITADWKKSTQLALDHVHREYPDLFSEQEYPRCRYGGECRVMLKPGGCQFRHTAEEFASSKDIAPPEVKDVEGHRRRTSKDTATRPAADQVHMGILMSDEKVPRCRFGSECRNMLKPEGCPYRHTAEELAFAAPAAQSKGEKAKREGLNRDSIAAASSQPKGLENK